MRFGLTDEQVGFAAALGDLMVSAGSVRVARAWADGDTRPGLELWHRLADLGVSGLAVPEAAGGAGGTPVDLVVAFEVLGNGLAVGPWIESAAYLPAVLATATPVGALARGAAGTVAGLPQVPYALDADVADHAFVVVGGALYDASVGAAHRSVDGTRRLFAVTPAAQADFEGDIERGFDLAALACAAELLGTGERLLADAVRYARQRRQFGREIGSYQAIKHQLADVRIALDFARPLVLGAAVGFGTLADARSSTTACAVPEEAVQQPSRRARDVSAAKVSAADAAYLASRVALQVHGAVGYTDELDLGLWIKRVRALVGAWGTPAFHRGRVLDALVSPATTSIGG